MTNTPIVNPADMEQLMQLDPVFHRIHEQYGPPPSWQRKPGFETLSRIILEQQVSLSSAQAHFEKLKQYLPGFTPTEILKLSDEEMRSCQISRQKAVYLRALSTALLEQQLFPEQLEELPDAEVKDLLMAVKGIGHWTSEVYLLFCLQRKDIFPSGDVALIQTVKELKRVNSTAIHQTVVQWQPLRSLAAFFCWHYYLSRRKRVAIF